MQEAIDGTEGRLAEFQSTRSLNLVAGQTTGVDAEITQLGRQIGEMRAIASQMAEAI